jgi:WD40 repeat protein
LTTGGDGEWRLWDRETLRRVITSDRKHQGVFNSARFNREGTRIVTAGGNERLSGVFDKQEKSTVQVWDANTGRMLQSIEQEGNINAALFNPDGNLVVFVGSNCEAILWAWEGNEKRELQNGCGAEGASNSRGGCSFRSWGHRTAHEFFTAAFSSNGRFVVTGGSDCLLRVWNVAEVKLDRTLPGHSGEVTQVAFSPNDKFILSASGLPGGRFDRAARLWDVETWQSMPLPGEDRVYGQAFSRDSRFAATGSGDNVVRVWDVNNRGSLWTVLRGHTHWVGSVSFSPTDSRLLVSTGSNDGTLRIWDIGSQKDRGRELMVLRGHQVGVGSAAFHQQGSEILSAGNDGTVRRWRVDFGIPIPERPARPARPKTIISPDGRLTMIVEPDQISLKNNRTKHDMPPLQARAIMADFSHDSKMIVTAEGYYAVTRIWNSDTGELVATLRAGADSAEFDQSDAFVVTASPDGARVWDVDTGQLIAKFVGGYEPYVDAAFADNNRSIITWLSDGRSLRHACDACRSENELLERARELTKDRDLTPLERKRFLHED